MALLEEAVEAFRAALQERTRERFPLQWARTQLNLGIALARLSEPQGGTARLEEAVEAFRAALLEHTRDQVPLDWATAQHNLGIALRRLGELQGGTVRLEEAVQAHCAALEERTRGRVPLDGAASLGEQGIAMMLIADRTDNGTMAETAVVQVETAYGTLHDGGHAPRAALLSGETGQSAGDPRPAQGAMKAAARPTPQPSSCGRKVIPAAPRPSSR
jgi:hypothetical protein